MCAEVLIAVGMTACALQVCDLHSTARTQMHALTYAHTCSRMLACALQVCGLHSTAGTRGRFGPASFQLPQASAAGSAADLDSVAHNAALDP
jgi:hypothetical protein